MLAYALGRDETGLASTWCLEKVKGIESYEVSVGTQYFHCILAAQLSRVTIYNLTLQLGIGFGSDLLFSCPAITRCASSLFGVFGLRPDSPAEHYIIGTCMMPIAATTR